ncbi:hypothetical protein P5V15_004812 [Pogonomyrmex californicus]
MNAIFSKEQVYSFAIAPARRSNARCAARHFRPNLTDVRDVIDLTAVSKFAFADHRRSSRDAGQRAYAGRSDVPAGLRATRSTELLLARLDRARLTCVSERRQKKNSKIFPVKTCRSRVYG